MVQIQRLESIIGDLPDRFGGVSLAPAVFFADEQPHIRKAVDPVDRPQFDVADVPVAILEHDCQKDVIAIPSLWVT